MMELMPPKPQDMIDTTDSLEAVDACRSMRFFLFWFIILPTLLIPQIAFWLDQAGRIDRADGCVLVHVNRWMDSAFSATCRPQRTGPLFLAATTEAEPAAQPAADAEPTDIERAVQEIAGDGLRLIPATPVQDETPQEEAQSPVFSGEMTDFTIPCSVVSTVVAICNFLLILAAVVYALVLLLCLKISLVGRLGGLFHITKALFIALFLLVILIPWQVMIPGVLVGAMWLPSELLSDLWNKAQDSTFWQVLFYLRFVGLWLVALFLLFWSRSRFVKWRQATMRRLGVVR